MMLLFPLSKVPVGMESAMLLQESKAVRLDAKKKVSVAFVNEANVFDNV